MNRVSSSRQSSGAPSVIFARSTASWPARSIAAKTWGAVAAIDDRIAFADDLAASPEIARIVTTLLAMREEVCRRLGELDREGLAQAKTDPVCRRFMTVPGVGAIVARSVRAGIDEPTRFAKS